MDMIWVNLVLGKRAKKMGLEIEDGKTQKQLLENRTTVGNVSNPY